MANHQIRSRTSSPHISAPVGRWTHQAVRVGLILALLLTGLGSGNLGVAQAAAPAVDAAPQTASGITLLDADEGSMTLAFDFDLNQLQVDPSPSVDATGRTCQNVILAGAVADETPGLPGLPLVSKLVGIPPGVEVSVKSVELDPVTLPGVYHICPALDKGTQVDDAGTGTYVESKVQPDPAVYGVALPYPAQTVAFGDLGYMRSQRLGRVQVSPVQIDPVAGRVTLHRRVLVTLSFDQAGMAALASRALTSQAVAESAPFEATFAKTLLNYEQARAWRLDPGSTDGASALFPAGAGEAPTAIWTPPSPAYRVKVNTTGIYQLSYSDLSSAGLPVGTLTPASLRLFNAGKEIPITVTGEGDGKFDAGDAVIFYGEAVDTRYTDTNVYWLTYGGANGLRMQQATTGGNGTPATSYAETVTFERNINYVSSLPKVEGFDHWYDVKIDALGAAPGVRLYTLAASDLAQTPFTATLSVAVGSHTLGLHHMTLRVNGQVVGDFQWNNRAYHEVQTQVPHSILSTSNSVMISISNDLSGQPIDTRIDTIYVDWLSLSYQRQLLARNGRLDFGDAQAGSWSYAVSGFSGGDVTVYDVTTPGQVAVVPAEVNGGVVSFDRTNAAARRYVAVEAAQRLSPTAIEGVNSVSLQAGGPSTGADYIIISPSEFVAAVQPLADYRATTGLRVRSISLQDVYDQFNYGLPSAEAIRDFLSYAYGNWPGTPPSYVLLVGDGTYDLRNYLSTSAPTYLPPFLAMVDPDLGQTASDNRFVTLVGNDLLADMYIGRFPVNSVAETTIMVEKTIKYETDSPSGPWQKKALFITDDLQNGGGAFYAFSDSVADGTVDGTTSGDLLLPSEYQRTKVYMGQTCAVENPSVVCRNQINQALNEGVAIMSFVGHGTKDAWTAEKLYDESLILGLNNGDKQPVILAMTCQEGYFQLPDKPALAEISVRSAGKGAVASWSPTGFGLATGHDLMERGFMLAVFHKDMPLLGQATQYGKLFLHENSSAGRYDDLLDTFMLFGDPALRMVGVDSGSTIFLPLLVR